MALDGMFLNCIKEELLQVAVGARVDKVYQPSREEIVLVLRSRSGSYRLLMSARANSPRVHFTEYMPENPQTPPMLCMLLRKRLSGAVLTDIRQVELDRILFFDFDATNEIGDRVRLSLCIEIMAQYSNIILIDDDGKIIDALKRVDFTKSSVRQVLPTLDYQLPPQQGKVNLISGSVDEAIKKIMSFGTKSLSSAILSSVMGVSPIVCRELAFLCYDDVPVLQLDDSSKERLKSLLIKLAETLNAKSYVPTIIYDKDKNPIDFSFFKINQYGTLFSVCHEDSFSALLDMFYYEKDRFERISRRSQDLRKALTNASERIAKKLDLQRTELENCSDREKLRVFAELITAHQHALKKGSFLYEVPNYYENDKIIRIPADPALNPMHNSQKYYKEYRKSYTAEKMLKELIESGAEELIYIESVLDNLTRASSERELAEIRQELTDSGYLRKKGQKGKNKKQPAPLPPLCFYSSDGFKILVGRNNVQNDRLSLKTASKNDIWLHTKDFPGAHVIIISDNQKVSDTAINQAAVIAGVYSKACNSSQVPVDYTLVKNLKKPNRAKPGKVIYHIYNTIYVNPDAELVKTLIEK